MQKKKGFVLILFFVHFQKWLIAVATLPYIVRPVQKVMENGGAMENVNGKMDNAYTLIVSIVITYWCQNHNFVLRNYAK